jgi:hypothetical protein
MPQQLCNFPGSTGFRRTGGRAPAAVALVFLLATACRQAPAPTQPATADVSGAPYPTLDTVPPRPQLGYSLEQRRAIEGQLAGDREHAAYMEAVLDYETGRTSTPPPPPPASSRAEAKPKAPSAAKERVRGPGDSPEVEEFVADALERDRDDGELKDFIRKLERPVPGRREGDSMAAALGLAAEPAAGTSGRPSGSSGLQRFGGFLGGLLGTAAPADPQPAGGTVVGHVAFAPASQSLPAGADDELARALAKARDAAASLRITGGGSLAEARTRAVAEALTRLGAAPGQLDVAPGGEGEDVRLTLTPRRGA